LKTTNNKHPTTDNKSTAMVPMSFYTNINAARRLEAFLESVEAFVLCNSHHLARILRISQCGQMSACLDQSPDLLLRQTRQTRQTRTRLEGNWTLV